VRYYQKRKGATTLLKAKAKWWIIRKLMKIKEDLSEKVIAVAVGIFIAAYVLPSAITAIFAVNTTTWSTDAQNMWAVLPVIGVLAIFLAFIYLAKKKVG
jgi:preprotein translocase subunit SecY